MSFITGDIANAVLQIAQGVLAYKFCQEQMNQMNLQLQTADQYYFIFRQQRAFYRTVFQSGESQDVLPPNGTGGLLDFGIFSPSAGAEECIRLEAVSQPSIGLGRYEPDYNGYSASVHERQGEYVINILYHFNALPTSLSRRHERMQLRPDARCLNYLQQTVAATNADSINYWFRYEEYHQIVENERRFEHSMNSMNFGMKRANMVNTGLGMSMDVVGSSRTMMADLYGKASNTMAGMLGYQMTRRYAGSQAGVPAIRPNMPGPGFEKVNYDTERLAAYGHDTTTMDAQGVVERARMRQFGGY